MISSHLDACLSALKGLKTSIHPGFVYHAQKKKLVECLVICLRIG